MEKFWLIVLFYNFLSAKFKFMSWLAYTDSFTVLCKSPVIHYFFKMENWCIDLLKTYKHDTGCGKRAFVQFWWVESQYLASSSLFSIAWTVLGKLSFNFFMQYSGIALQTSWRMLAAFFAILCQDDLTLLQ